MKIKALLLLVLFAAFAYFYAEEPQTHQAQKHTSTNLQTYEEVQASKSEEVKLSQESISPLPVKNILISEENFQTSSSESEMGKSYQKVAEITVEENSLRYEVQFEKPLHNYLSFLVIGKEGTTKLKNTSVQFLGDGLVQEEGLNKKYFPRDWYRMEQQRGPIKSIQFDAQSFAGAGKIALYIQRPLGGPKHEN